MSVVTLRPSVWCEGYRSVTPFPRVHGFPAQPRSPSSHFAQLTDPRRPRYLAAEIIFRIILRLPIPFPLSSYKHHFWLSNYLLQIPYCPFINSQLCSPFEVEPLALENNFLGSLILLHSQSRARHMQVLEVMTPSSWDFRTIVSYLLPDTHQAAWPLRWCGSSSSIFQFN